jgi:DNA-binding transcriptional MocR family regulator
MLESSSTQRLVTHLRREIESLRPGDRLPSTRELVESHQVSPITVSRALATLAAEGAVVTRPGSGTFRAEPAVLPQLGDLSWQSLALGDRVVDTGGMASMLSTELDDRSIAFAGYPHPNLAPARLLASSLNRASRLPDAFDRPPTQGLLGLRNWFARAAAPGVEARDVLITPGGQPAISAAVRATVAAGEPLLVESPTYPGVLAIARAAGIRPVPVPVDCGGVSVPDLAAAFARSGARAVYLQTTFQNPTGTVLAAERRQAVLSVAREAGAFVIEDDYARLVGHGRPPAPPLLADDTDGRVIYLTSLTKIAAASLRIGAVISRGAVTERIRSLRLVDDMFVAKFVQEAALDLLTSAGWERHLRVTAQALRSRCDLLLNALRRELPGVGPVLRPAGGLHLWVPLPSELQEGAVAEAAREAGVMVTVGRPFHPAEPPGPRLRLSFATPPDLTSIEEGVRRLAEAVSALR